MAILQVTDESFQSDVLGADKPVLVDFWAEWCGPCKAIAPALESLAETMEGKLTVAKVNIDDNPQTPSTYNVRGIPTLIIFQASSTIRLCRKTNFGSERTKWGIGLILIILSSVSSCGQKGPLYYPDKDNAFLSDHQNIT